MSSNQNSNSEIHRGSGSIQTGAFHNISQEEPPHHEQPARNQTMGVQQSSSLGPIDSLEGVSAQIETGVELITPTGISHNPNTLANQLRGSHVAIREEDTAEESARPIDYGAIRDKRKSKKGKESNRQAFPVRVQTLNEEIIPRTGARKKHISHVRRPKPPPPVVGSSHRKEKLLDGFMLLYSCRVKLPHEAVKSRLSGQNITAVQEVDLSYFQNLVYLDLSDNKVTLEALLNLKALIELNLQYNQISGIQLPEGAFPKLQVLNLSFNRIPPSHLTELRVIKELRILDLSSNDLCTLPEDLSFLPNLEDLNLSSNQFTSEAFLVQPGKLFRALGVLPKLKKLNLARNKFVKLHIEEDPDTSLSSSGSGLFSTLQDLDFSYNQVGGQEGLSQTLEFKNLQFLNITGNPFAENQLNYRDLESQLYARVQAVVINYNARTAGMPSSTLMMRKYVGGGQVVSHQQMIQYNVGNVMKVSAVGGDQKKLVQAEMNKGVALPIADISGTGTEEGGQELFPSGKGHDDIFTPPDEMPGAKKKKQHKRAKRGKDGDFFITGGEHSDEENYEEEMLEEVEEMEEGLVDFGRQKMDQFKRICSTVLLSNGIGDYETPMELQQAYRTLKGALKNPKTCHPYHSNAGYLKMTFAALRQQKFRGATRAETPPMPQAAKSVYQQQNLPPILKKLGLEQSSGSRGLPWQRSQTSSLPDSHQTSKKYISRQEKIDKKINALIEQYRKRDVLPIYDHKRDKKKTFAFSDSEDEDIVGGPGQVAQDYLESDDDGSEDWGIADSDKN